MDRFDEAVECLRELIRFNSVEGEPACGAPFGKGVADALNYMLGVMENNGFRTFNGAPRSAIKINRFSGY